jgi:hypothetical protein
MHLMELVACNEIEGGASFDRLHAYDRLINTRQQRYLRAIETLARVRRLASRAPLQINIGERQLNVSRG